MFTNLVVRDSVDQGTHRRVGLMRLVVGHASTGGSDLAKAARSAVAEPSNANPNN